MTGLGSIVGVVIVALTMMDFICTTISIRRAGPLTSFVTRIVTAMLDRTRPDGAISIYRGPIILSLLAICWITALWVGWSLVMMAGRHALVGPAGDPARIIDVFGFVGSTLSTMGLGVVTPHEASWHLLAVLISITGMVVLTLTMSYIFNVTSVATASRALARRLDLLRMAADEADGSLHDLALASSESLLDQGTALIDRRASFPLAVHYDRQGTERDVRRAAEQTLEKLRGDPHRAPRSIDDRHLAMLDSVLSDVATTPPTSR